MSNIDLERTVSTDPDLTVTLTAQPPRQFPDEDPESWKGRLRHEWTLDNLERTLIEFRAAGGWDGSVVTLDSRGKVSCEVITGRDEDALPWGWVPSHQLPERKPERPRGVAIDTRILALVALPVVAWVIWMWVL